MAQANFRKRPTALINSAIESLSTQEDTTNGRVAANFSLYTKQGSTPATPAAGRIALYFDSTGALKSVNESGTVSGVGGGGSASYRYKFQDYQGDPQVGILGSDSIVATQTISKIVLECDTVPVGANLIVELRKNSTTSGNILTSTLQIATGATATNGYFRAELTTGFTAALAANDILYAVITTKPSTSGGFNARVLVYAS